MALNSGKLFKVSLLGTKLFNYKLPTVGITSVYTPVYMAQEKSIISVLRGMYDIYVKKDN